VGPRACIREGFDALEQRTAGSIEEEIAIIDASLQAIMIVSGRRSFLQIRSDLEWKRRA
jgi:hypothetical protein